MANGTVKWFNDSKGFDFIEQKDRGLCLKCSREKINMLSKKKYTTRSVIDRRSSLDRRIVDFGPMYPNNEQRIKQDRRQGWEKRYEWKSIDRLTSFPIQFKIPQPHKSL